jgi:hypothetical protein
MALVHVSNEYYKSYANEALVMISNGHQELFLMRITSLFLTSITTSVCSTTNESLMHVTKCSIRLLASAMTLAKKFRVSQVREGRLGGRGSQVDTATAPKMNIPAKISELFRQSHRPHLIVYCKFVITKSTPCLMRCFRLH